MSDGQMAILLLAISLAFAGAVAGFALAGYF